MKLHRFLPLVSLLLVVARVPAQTTYFTNLAEPNYNGVYVSSNLWAAQPFTTGADSGGYDLLALSLGLTQQSDATFSVSLWSDALDLPGSMIETFTFVGGSDFNPATPVVLAPSTTYWIVLGSTEPSNISTSYIWNDTEFDTMLPLGGWQVGDTYLTNNQGANWFYNLHYFKVALTAEAIAIPEPATWSAIFGIAALGLVAWRRRLH